MGSVRDTIFVLNDRFVPEASSNPYLYGVVQHAFQGAAALSAAGASVGFVLYRRDEACDTPFISQRLIPTGYRGVVVRFHFGMREDVVARAFHEAVVRAAVSASPVLYLQTSVLLPFLPPEYDIAITHHSPFVEDVIARIGATAARRAFDWDHPKTAHLRRFQERAVQALLERHNVICLEISVLQYRYLVSKGVPLSRVRRLPPPVSGRRGSDVRCLPEPLAGFLRERGPQGLVAITAVARLDYFKNIELFVEGCGLAIGDGHLDRALVVGGFELDPERERLKSLVPPDISDRILLTPRIGHDVLAESLFPALAGAGIFVCTSRFDLVPYTVLEAARVGLATAVPDHGNVGAAEYLPTEFLYSGSRESLAVLLAGIAADPGMLVDFGSTARAIAELTSDEAFVGVFRGLSRAKGRPRGSPAKP